MPVRVKPPPAEIGEIISPGWAALATTIPLKGARTTVLATCTSATATPSWATRMASPAAASLARSASRCARAVSTACAVFSSATATASWATRTCSVLAARRARSASRCARAASRDCAAISCRS